MIVIVGAGLAGLVCARMLRQAGRQVLMLEQQGVPGGRVRTERHPEGFLLDRGFQVLFTAYPAAQRHLSLSRLDLRAFKPGALIAHGGKQYAIADPLRAPEYAVRSALLPLFGLGDKVRALALALSVRRESNEAIFAGADQTTAAYLQGRGFSPRFVDTFIRPFYGGIFLDRALDTSSSMFRFTYKMLSQGETAVPAAGMQQIPEQLAKALPADAIHYGVTVTAIAYDQGRATGVMTEDGQRIEAEAVVIATDPPTAARLLDVPLLPHQPVGCTCVYFATASSLYPEKLIVLNAYPDAYVNNMVQIDNIAPDYAPRGQHLLSLTIVGSDPGEDEQIEQRCLADLARLFPRAALAELRLLRIMRIPFAQFAQPPGVFRGLGEAATATDNIFLASEATRSSSIQGAMAGGEQAARLLLERLPEKPVRQRVGT
jgi:phytoene dehydrogenase-like protein